MRGGVSSREFVRGRRRRASPATDQLARVQRGQFSMMGGMRGMADIPDLVGQHAAYVVAQLDKFERGQRPSTIMGRIAATLGDYDKKAVAEYVAGLR